MFLGLSVNQLCEEIWGSDPFFIPSTLSDAVGLLASVVVKSPSLGSLVSECTYSTSHKGLVQVQLLV